MSTLWFILTFTILSSLGSLIGGILLLYHKHSNTIATHYLTAFAAGTMLAAAFLDLLPEAVEAADGQTDVYLWVLSGMLLLFFMERFLQWFHHHAHDETPQETVAAKQGSQVIFVTLSDTVHNFMDGIALASTFLVSTELGMVTAFAIFAHEVPQEIGDFGIMMKNGVKSSKIIILNVFSAGMAILGALVGYYLGGSIESFLPIMLGLAAGFFIYISASDLIPEIHREHRHGVAFAESFMLLLGAIVIWLVITLFEH